jgi:DNA-binding FadR family transcriptional regulator
MLQASASVLRTVHRQVADHIGMSVVRGDIAPGEPLPSEVRICEMLQVSRTVVREAIRTLIAKGLVESRAKSGTRVCPPELWNRLDPDVLRWQLDTAEVDAYLAKLFQLRYAVEPAAAAAAAISSTEDDRRRLRQAYHAMRAATGNEDFIVADIAFHKCVFFATGNEFFWPIAQMLEVTLRGSLTIAAPGDHRPRGLIDHRDILEAIEQRDPVKARQMTIVLLNHSAGDLVRIRGVDPFEGLLIPPA